MSMTDFPQEQLKMTAEAYRDLPESPHKTELINGELIVYKGAESMSPAPKDTHQRAFTSLFLGLGNLIQDLGGELRGAPTDVYLDSANAVQPDIFWVSPDNTNCVLKDDGYWYGAPDLVIEILSPATAVRDKTDKYALYERHGVKTYWIVDTFHMTIDVYVLENDIFAHRGVYDKQHTFTTSILGEKTVQVAELLP